MFLFRLVFSTKWHDSPIKNILDNSLISVSAVKKLKQYKLVSMRDFAVLPLDW